MKDNNSSAGESQPAMGVIYLITNTLNGKPYVGQTRQKLERRINYHKSYSKKAKSGVDAAIAKYGWENFSVEVLEVCPVAMLNEREKFWIAALNSKVPHGYNLTDGGDTDTIMSAESRAKLSAALKGRAAPNKGITHTAEVRAKISAALKGRAAHNKGVSPSAEARAKMSAAQKAIGNIPPNHKGKKRGPRSPETKAKLSAANKGKHPSEETLAKMSAAQKARWAKKKAVENGGK